MDKKFENIDEFLDFLENIYKDLDDPYLENESMTVKELKEYLEENILKLEK